MAERSVLPPPKSVSPLIRFGRWAALLTGVAYGSWRLGYLTRREVKIREHEDKIRAKRDVLLKADREGRERVELTQLAKEVGISAEELLAAAGLSAAPAAVAATAAVGKGH